MPFVIIKNLDEFFANLPPASERDEEEFEGPDEVDEAAWRNDFDATLERHLNEIPEFRRFWQLYWSDSPNDTREQQIEAAMLIMYFDILHPDPFEGLDVTLEQLQERVWEAEQESHKLN
ncbi:hypothetical protein HYS03_00850 [Candidatus Woesebacteria bacterium]|nr:hypothetical protein [Candidatus Woesebacteria bacterium]QQG47210.1 MAG: hypothetical protein HY044_03660 [Candidatus Woesebacteria bacterium]